jgi:hypothetical protein
MSLTERHVFKPFSEATYPSGQRSHALYSCLANTIRSCESHQSCDQLYVTTLLFHSSLSRLSPRNTVVQPNGESRVSAGGEENIWICEPFACIFGVSESYAETHVLVRLLICELPRPSSERTRFPFNRIHWHCRYTRAPHP